MYISVFFYFAYPLVMLDGRIKLRHLQCFLAVAEQRSIQRAAERLAVTQPAVSKTLRELEEILGVQLFRRGRKGTQPTADAEAFQRYASASVSALQQGIDSVAQARRRGGVVLRLGVLPSVAPCFAPPALLRFRAEMPGALLQVASGRNADLLERLKARELDLALARLSDPDRMTGLTFEHLYADSLALVVRPGHPLLAGAAPTLAAVAAWPAILADKGTTIRQSSESLLAAHGVASPRTASRPSRCRSRARSRAPATWCGSRRSARSSARSRRGAARARCALDRRQRGADRRRAARRRGSRRRRCRAAQRVSRRGRRWRGST